MLPPFLLLIGLNAAVGAAKLNQLEQSEDLPESTSGKELETQKSIDEDGAAGAATKEKDAQSQVKQILEVNYFTCNCMYDVQVYNTYLH